MNGCIRPHAVIQITEKSRDCRNKSGAIRSAYLVSQNGIKAAKVADTVGKVVTVAAVASDLIKEADTVDADPPKEKNLMVRASQELAPQ